MSATRILLLFAFVHAGTAFAVPSLFSGKGALGEGVSIKPSAAKRGTVLLFLSAKCPCSASHEPVLANLYREFSGQGFQFLGIHSNGDEPESLVRAHFQSAKLPFPVLRDPGSKLADELGAYKTPHAFVLDPRGEIVFQGGVDDSHTATKAERHHLKDALIALKEGRKPDPSVVRTLGCIIKRKETP